MINQALQNTFSATESASEFRVVVSKETMSTSETDAMLGSVTAAMRSKDKNLTGNAATAQISVAKTFFDNRTNLCCFAVEVLEQPAETCFALDVGKRTILVNCSLIWTRIALWQSFYTAIRACNRLVRS
ncbi:MAG: hypothetical protein IT427_14365 [Pirellulales bacterium]|nr:hypothetical protein [Pirellulales bacterium]